jgi:hypothetical protein
MIGKECALLLCGGDKRKQAADIERAAEYLKDYKDKDRNLMKRKASTSHDEAIVRRLRKHPDFAAEYLKASLEDGDGPRLKTTPKLLELPASSARVFTGPCRYVATHGFPRWSPSLKQSD